MKRLILMSGIAALLLPGAALAKGPSAASMEAEGGGSRITFSGDEGSGPLGNLTQQSGWFAGAFAQEPNPMLSSRPKGDLGPKYTVTYTVPGPNNKTHTIRQDIYPYAADGPVTYMAPGQPIFDMTTRGGWFQAGPELKETLVAAGLPRTAAAASGSSDGGFPTAELLALLAAALVLAAATAVVLRRRTHPAPAA